MSEHQSEGAGHGHADDGEIHAHVSSVNFYLAIFGALILLTVFTVAVAYVHLGALNLAVAVVVASIKAGLVVLFFMHLRHDHKFNALIFVSALLFAGVFLAYTMNDTETRARLDHRDGARRLETTGEVAPGWQDGLQATPYRE